MKNSAEFTEQEKQFAELLQKMSEEDLTEKNIQFRPVDYSFMDEPVEQPMKRTSKRRFVTHMARVAVIILCFGIAVFGTAIWLNSQQAEAGGFRLEQLIHQIKEGIFGVEEDIYVDESTTTITIDKWEDIEKAKKFAPEWKVPGYLPEGAELVSLEITKWSDEEIYGSYIFSMKDGEALYISVMSCDENDELRVENIIETMEVEGKTVYISLDEITEIRSASYMEDSFVISISGQLESDELLKIVEKLN